MCSGFEIELLHYGEAFYLFFLRILLMLFPSTNLYLFISQVLEFPSKCIKQLHGSEINSSFQSCSLLFVLSPLFVSSITTIALHIFIIAFEKSIKAALM